MSPSRPRSFRRILILRILLLSIPILLIGQYVTLRKARTSLLETARQNLTSSAIQKAVDLSQDIRFLDNSLQLLTQTQALQTGDPAEIEAFLQNQLGLMPALIDCVQLADEVKGAIAYSTCNGSLLSQPPPTLPWRFPTVASPTNKATDFSLVYVGLLPDDRKASSYGLRSTPEEAVTGTNQTNSTTRLNLVLAAPVYTPDGVLRYTLTLRAKISQSEKTGPGFMTGNTVIINQAGQVLLHPDVSQIGKPISDWKDEKILRSIIKNVQEDRSNTVHLFHFLPVGEEWLAGYTGIDVPITATQTERWTILSVTPLDYALQGLQDIRNSLIVLTLGLLGANGILALMVARSLSLPIEQLSQYAQQMQDLNHLKEAPKNFQVRELQNLATVFTSMIKRLEERAQELRHAWQDAQMANQLKSEFLANTSHELRTPLNAIIGCIRLVKDECCDSREEEMEFLERADNAAIHLLRIINDILDIAKIESGTLSLKPETSDLRAILQEVIDLQTVHIQQKKLTLVQSEMESPVWILADRAKLKQVLLNILYNAIKFTDKGQVSIETQIQLDADTPSSQPSYIEQLGIDIAVPRILIVISDTGIGVDPQQQHRLFRPFVMIDGSTTRRFEGTGLGLAISKNFMDLMGGSIHLYSEGIGKGTTVILALPLAQAPETIGARRVDPEDSLNPDAPAANKPLVASADRTNG
ncbi:MAG TPA: ATP-binding protein [Leptolyngbyaceae cyanobacterium]